MDPRINKLKREIRNFYELQFGGNLLFVIVYGSWVFGLNNKDSDVDMVGVCSRFNRQQMKNTITFVKNLHKKYGLDFDEEVPYEKKVLATSKFLEKAIFGDGFLKNKGKIQIQPIVKTKSFLSSDKMALRLLLNAITTKNVFCGGEYFKYTKAKNMALKNCVRIFYSAWKVDKIDLDTFVDRLISRNGKSGQFYLGFEDKGIVRSYLKKAFRKTFNSLLKEGYLKKERSFFVVNDLKWLKEINFTR